MLRIQIIPRGDENIYHILRQKIDNEARTFVWADNKKSRLRHVMLAHAGRLRIRDANGVLIAETYKGDQIVGAFIGRLAAWFPVEIAAINIQLFLNDTVRKKRRKK
jgi:hypothetical protein